MIVRINKHEYENEYNITVWDNEKEIPLDRKLEQLKFTNEQIDFLDIMFHKLVNRKITIS